MPGETATNFHKQTGVRPSAFGERDKTRTQGENKNDYLTNESLYEWKVDTFAKQILASRLPPIRSGL